MKILPDNRPQARQVSTLQFLLTFLLEGARNIVQAQWRCQENLPLGRISRAHVGQLGRNVTVCRLRCTATEFPTGYVAKNACRNV